MSRALAIRAGALLALCGAVVAGCGGGGDSSSSSTAAQNLTDCNINGRQQSLGASYVTSIEVAKIGCGQAERLVAAYHRCRLQHGGPGGRCTSAVIGFTCTEGAREGVPKVQYNASVDCRKGGAEVKSTYTQNF